MSNKIISEIVSPRLDLSLYHHASTTQANSILAISGFINFSQEDNLQSLKQNLLKSLDMLKKYEGKYKQIEKQNAQLKKQVRELSQDKVNCNILIKIYKQGEVWNQLYKDHMEECFKTKSHRNELIEENKQLKSRLKENRDELDRRAREIDWLHQKVDYYLRQQDRNEKKIEPKITSIQKHTYSCFKIIEYITRGAKNCVCFDQDENEDSSNSQEQNHKYD